MKTCRLDVVAGVLSVAGPHTARAINPLSNTETNNMLHNVPAYPESHRALSCRRP
jgi:hypothetical protein